MAKILVTGGSGFIGTNLVQYLLDRGDSVMNLDIRPPRNVLHSGYWREVDLLDARLLSKTVGEYGPRDIYHLAARTDLAETNEIGGYAANVEGVRNLVGAIQVSGSVRRCIVASSQLVCRVGYLPRDDADYAPSTFYGESKIRTEQIVRETNAGGAEWCIVRPTTVWGPWCSPHYQTFIRLIQRGYYFHVGSRERHKSFSYVGNFCHQIHALMEADRREIQGRTFYLADYEPLSLRAWSEAFRRELGAPKIRTVPLRLAKVAAIIGDLLAKAGFANFPFTSFRLNNLLTEYVFDLSDTRRIVPLLPCTMADGVKETVAWLARR